MSNVARVASTAANTLTTPPSVEDVFSTYLYDGTGATQTITNGIDLDGEGGMTWIKLRNSASNHELYDTERGATYSLCTNTSNAPITRSTGLTSFNSNGFTVGSGTNVNANNYDVASWTFRKAPKFFDVVTYTGDGTAGRTVSHNLGSVPGCIMVKRTSSTEDWVVYHVGADATSPEDYYFKLNTTAARIDSTAAFNDTAPTSTQFTLGNNGDVNASSETYVAYLFAHNDGDGVFGPDGDADIIKCGSYTGNGSTDGPEIDLGFEPQWVMQKRTDSTGDWQVFDNMRGITTGGNDAFLRANTSDAESDGQRLDITATGFQLKTTAGSVNASGGTYIYIAIRRGPMAVPTSATDVFAIDTRTGSLPSYVSTFPVDMALRKLQSISANWTIGSRLTGTGQLETSSTNAEGTDTDWAWDYMEGYGDDPNVAYALYSWMWKRAPNYFDVVAYDGADVPQTVSHNLGVAPEMMWVKRRNAAWDWYVYHKDLDATNPSHKYLKLNDTAAVADWDGAWNDTDPTSSVFSVGEGSNPTNVSGGTYIAYLFASLDGVSKVGSFTYSGSPLNVDCGFTNGARFVLIKCSGAAGSWLVFDSERGIVAGNDPYLQLNTTSAEDSGYDVIDPYSAGFTVAGGLDQTTHIFYAIA